MDTNDSVAAPAVDEPVEEPQIEENTQPEVAEPVAEGAEAPEAEASTEETPQATLQTEEDSEEDVDLSYNLPTTPYEFQAEDGFVDPNQVAQQIENRLLEKMRFERSEQKAWEKIEQKYPQVKNDKELREIILNQRLASAYQGKNVALPKVADSIMSRFTSAKSEGRAEANVSRKIQKSASLETSTANQGESKKDDVWDRISNGDKRAADDLFSSWLKEGKI